MPSVHERALSPVALSGSTAMNRSPRAFLSAVREEILAPVNAIITLSDALLAETRDLENEQADFVNDLGRIHSAGKHLLEMINEHLDPDAVANADDPESGLAIVQKRVRHDMRNALNPVINYTEMWLEEAAEVFLEGFVEDLRRIHGLGKTCLGLLDKVAAYQQGQLPDEDARPTQAAINFDDPLFKWQVALDARAASEPGYCLVVDDNATNRDILCRLLVRQGHRVATAVNGREALAMAAAEPFDIVLLDIIMPEMNGFEVLHHLKADDRLRSVPVIMISALDQDDAVLRCIAMGAEDYLPRPFNPLLLKARLGACLEKKRFRDRETQYLRQIEHEKQKADDLLHVILPDKIVDELKATGEVRPRRVDRVAVLFADLKGFTQYCKGKEPEEVVPHLQHLVEAWENCAVRHGVEKIKTIGDAFMAAAGLLQPLPNPVLACVHCGLEMIQAVHDLPVSNWETRNLRVGVHVGQVMAGVIGRRQYLFDLWGETVNTAARMESHGRPGCITLTPEAWELVAPLVPAQPPLASRPRQEVVKSMGAMTVYDIECRPSP